MFSLVFSNPWYVLVIGIILYFVWQKLNSRAGNGDSSASLSKYLTVNFFPPITFTKLLYFIDPEEILARQEARETVMRRMQEEYDAKAKEFAAKQREVTKTTRVNSVPRVNDAKKYFLSQKYDFMTYFLCRLFSSIVLSSIFFVVIVCVIV